VKAIREIMATRTSIGGIRDRGVPHGLALVDEAVRAGYCWFVRSDIKDFFTRIPKAQVNAFIRDAVDDSNFAALFEHALATNLVNQDELEERHLFKLFPDPEIGAPQGSALSALAGNIVLRGFDDQMNGRDIICVRYIDDFMLLGTTQQKVLAAYNSARNHLANLGMVVYDLSDAKARAEGKVDGGNIYQGTDFLGYHISGRSRQPSKTARAKLLNKLDCLVSDAEKAMRAAANRECISTGLTYYQAMVLLNKTVWGWSQAFRHTTARHIFGQLDREIDKRIRILQSEARQLIGAGDEVTSRLVMGIHLLEHTKLHPLPWDQSSAGIPPSMQRAA
jgi:hypothetical protein